MSLLFLQYLKLHTIAAYFTSQTDVGPLLNGAEKLQIRNALHLENAFIQRAITIFLCLFWLLSVL